MKFKPRWDVYDVQTAERFERYRELLAAGKVESKPRFFAELVLDEYVTDQNFGGATSYAGYGDTVEAAKATALRKLQDAVNSAETVERK